MYQFIQLVIQPFIHSLIHLLSRSAVKTAANLPCASIREYMRKASIIGPTALGAIKDGTQEIRFKAYDGNGTACKVINYNEKSRPRQDDRNVADDT